MNTRNGLGSESSGFVIRGEHTKLTIAEEKENQKPGVCFSEHLGFGVVDQGLDFQAAFHFRKVRVVSLFSWRWALSFLNKILSYKKLSKRNRLGKPRIQVACRHRNSGSLAQMT